jgi:hypothetical protein
MTRFATMAERHAFGLEAVAEMTGKLLQAAFQRASHPADPEDQDRAILLFDRLARGFRLTLALESRLERDRRREAAGLPAEAATPGLSATPSATTPRPPREDDRERDVDLEPSDLTDHVRDLRRVVADDADILDPDGAHAVTLDRWAGAWGEVLRSTAGPDADAAEASPATRRSARPASAPALAIASAPRAPPRRASG